MSTMIHYPGRDCVSPLGIPVDNLDLAQTVEQIIAMAKRRDGRARLVSTLNVDFLVNALGTRFRRARHPELLDVLRHSDLVTADGFPILWLSRIVGRPLKERVCGSDLVPALAPRARDEGLSLFLLGGGEGSAESAARRLQARHPGLRIAGTAAPFIHTAGPGLANCDADDDALVAAINASGADILLVGLGNPKQELWFNRNRDQLTVPVSMGVGGTFEFITGAVRRAPAWLQRCNLEWLYRITQDPGRLWRRYGHGLFKLAALSAPLLQARLAELAAFAIGAVAKPDSLRWRRVWANREQTLSVLRLPRLVTREYLQAVLDSLVQQPAGAARYLLDFDAVRKVEMAGHPLLLALSELQQSGERNLQCLGIPERLRRDLAVTRVLDAMREGQGDTLALLGTATSGGAAFSCQSYALDDAALVFLGGRVTGADLRRTGFSECLQHMARDRDCYLDLRGVTLLEAPAIAALSPFFGARLEGGGRVLFSGLSPALRQMLRVAGLGEPHWRVPDRQLLDVIYAGGEAHD